MSLIKKIHTNKISTKITLATGIVFIGFTSVLALITGSMISQSIEEVYLEQAKHQISTVSNVVQNYYDNITENVNMLATNPKIRSAVEGTITSYKEVPTATFIKPSELGEGLEFDIYTMFTEFANSHPTAKYVYLATEDGGYTQWPEVEMPANYDPTTRGWYQTAIGAKGSVVQTEPYSTTEGGTIISNVRAVYGMNDELLGVVGIDFEQEFISELISELSVGQNGYYMLTHPNGTILADGKYQDHIFKSLEELENPALQESIQTLKEQKEMQMADNQYITYSDTINHEGWIVTAAVDEYDFYSKVKKIITNLVPLAIGFTALTIIIMSLILKRMIAPIKKASQYLKAMREADFSVKIDNIPANTAEETANIITGLNDVKESLVTAVSQINTNTDEIKNEIVDITHDVVRLSEHMEEISSTSQELAAAMEETSSLADEMLSTSQEMKKEIEIVEKSSKLGLEQSSVIRNRAEESMDKLTASQEKNSEVLSTNKDYLEKALMNSKVVSEIDSLTTAIMHITEQTNLLALNASIEAARAGEHGKGFAVVADEIGKLATQSKTMTLKIQEVIEKVISAVDELSSGANGLLAFVETDIAKDYHEMSQIVELYKSDADKIESMTKEFKLNAETLSKAVATITESINCVASSAAEGALSTGEIAAAVSESNDLTTIVNHHVHETESHISSLKESISVFKI